LLLLLIFPYLEKFKLTDERAERRSLSVSLWVFRGEMTEVSDVSERKRKKVLDSPELTHEVFH
jgi:hypothetical protein